MSSTSTNLWPLCSDISLLVFQALYLNEDESEYEDTAAEFDLGVSLTPTTLSAQELWDRITRKPCYFLGEVNMAFWFGHQ